MSPIPTPLRIFYGVVATFTLYVTFWGLIAPLGLGAEIPGFAKNFNDALPFTVQVPPLHARFLGALYLSATVFNVLNITSAKHWFEARIPTLMIFLWTGTLLLISLFNMALFDWTRPPVWSWFLAYLAFPTGSGLALWWYRGEVVPPGGAPIPPALRQYFWVQGVLVTLLALTLLLLPGVVIAIWPWNITPFLSQLYSGPFLAYGISSLVAARAQRWDEVRIFVWSVLVFPLAAIIASLLHLNLFNFGGPSAWVWFSSLVLIALALMALPRLVRAGR